jgi:type II secretion system protein N
MKERLKKYAPYVGYPIFYLVALLVFSALTFPFGRLKDRVVTSYNAEQRKRPGPQQELRIEDLSSWRLTGVRAKGVKLLTASVEPGQPPSELAVDEARARLAILPLLVGRRQVNFQADALGGEVEGSFSESSKERTIEVDLDGVDLGALPMIKDALGGLPMEGKAVGAVKLSLPEGKASKGSGTITVDINDVAIGDGKAKIKGALALPKVTVGTLSFVAEAKEGILKISKLAAGGKDIELAGEGRVQMREMATESLVDVNLRFKINDNYRSKNDVTKSLFGAPGSNAPALFELDPKVKQAKRPDGFYGFHARGLLGRLEFQPAPNASPR